MIEPMMPAGWKKPPEGSAPKSRYPRNPPTNDPMMPMSRVMPMDRFCFPGTTRRAIAPAMIPTMMMISLSASGAAMVADAESTFRGQLAELVSPAISADQVEFALATWRHFVVRSRTRASASPPGRPGFRGPLRCPLSRRQVLPAHRFRTPGDS